MPSVGYCVARQGPNGVIHLITTLNHPALHFEMSEAWILGDATYAEGDPAMDHAPSSELTKPISRRENYADGGPRVEWTNAIAADGRVLLNGKETWFYPNGAKQHETEYRAGVKVGVETYWSPALVKQWEWNHHDN